MQLRKSAKLRLKVALHNCWNLEATNRFLSSTADFFLHVGFFGKQSLLNADLVLFTPVGGKEEAIAAHHR